MATPDDFRARYLDELVGSASVLDGVEQAAIAEAWASGAIAEWLALEGAPGTLAQQVAGESALAAQLIHWLERGELPSGSPDWLDDVGRHEITRAVQLGAGPDRALIFEYEAPSGDRHDLSVSIEGGRLVGVAIGPEGLASAAADHDDIPVEQIDQRQAIELVRETLLQPLGELTSASEATIPLLAERMNIAIADLGGQSEASHAAHVLPERFPEDDRYAADVLTSALRSELTSTVEPAEVAAARDRFGERVAAHDPDALTLLEIAGFEADQAIDAESFLALVGAYLAPVSLAPHSPQQFEALIDLEAADWVGAVLGIGRAAPGIDIDGEVLVRFINKCPEITTSIPKSDAPRLAWAFEQTLYAWELTSVLDGDGALTSIARWLVPRAAIARWA